MGKRSAKLFHSNVFARDGFDDVGAGDEHLTGFVDHDDEIGQSWRVDRAPCCGPTDNRNLGDNPGGLGIAFEDFTIFSERDDAFLDSGSPRIQDANERNLRREGEVHYLDDFVPRHLSQGSTKDGEVLRENGHLTPVNGP